MANSYDSFSVRTRCEKHQHSICTHGSQCPYQHTLVDIRRLERLLGQENTRNPEDTLNIEYLGDFRTYDERWGDGWRISVRRSRTAGAVKHDIVFTTTNFDLNFAIKQLELADVALDSLLSPAAASIGQDRTLCAAYATAGHCDDRSCRLSHHLFDISRVEKLVGLPRRSSAMMGGEPNIFAKLEYRKEYSSWKWVARILKLEAGGETYRLNRPYQGLDSDLTMAMLKLEKKVILAKKCS